MKQRKLNAAVIGCGRIGFGFDKDVNRKYAASHSGAYQTSSKYNLVGVCDTNFALAESCAAHWKGEVQPYSSIRDMFKNQKIDVVSICTLPETHEVVLKEVLKYSVKAVFCEKPIAHNIASAKRMIQLCKKKNVKLQIDHQRRFDKLHQKIRESIQKGKLGNFCKANFYYTAGIKNTGSHMFDLLRFLCGDIKKVDAWKTKKSGGNNQDPNLDGKVLFKSGASATFQSFDLNNYLLFELDAFFEKGRIQLKKSGFEFQFYGPEKSKLFAGYKDLERSSKLKFSDQYDRKFMIEAVNHLADCVQKKAAPLSRGEDGLAALECIEEAINSSKKSKERVL